VRNPLFIVGWNGKKRGDARARCRLRSWLPGGNAVHVDGRIRTSHPCAGTQRIHGLARGIGVAPGAGQLGPAAVSALLRQQGFRQRMQFVDRFTRPARPRI